MNRSRRTRWFTPGRAQPRPGRLFGPRLHLPPSIAVRRISCFAQECNPQRSRTDPSSHLRYPARKKGSTLPRLVASGSLRMHSRIPARRQMLAINP